MQWFSDISLGGERANAMMRTVLVIVPTVFRMCGEWDIDRVARPTILLMGEVSIGAGSVGMTAPDYGRQE